MNTKLLLPFLITGVVMHGSSLSGIALTQPPIQVAQSIWKPFSSTEGNFSILMPGTPNQAQETINTEIGSVNLNQFIVERPDEARYVVAYLDVPGNLTTMLQNPEQVNEFFNGVVSGLSQTIEGQILSQDNITLNNYLGKEFRVQHDDGVLGRYRLYLVQQRIYLLGVVTSKAQYLQKSIQGFFDSFKLAQSSPETVSPPTEAVSPPASDLNAQLRQAVCRQDWSQAINVINQMIGKTNSPEVRQQLVDYKQKLQNFVNSDVIIPSGELPDCS